MVNATEYRAMAAEHHHLAGMCRSPESREQHLRLEQGLRALAEREGERSADRQIALAVSRIRYGATHVA